ncbi:MAG: class I SAM-dependent methyltransferase [Ardenticatenaceae bacterium]|nr:class I SAM-dependent methyltransferase [Ardenticatenaceae bacterium]
MTQASDERATHGNRQKHENPNPLQKQLIERFHRRVAALIKETGAARLLDAGCGEGFGLRHLLKEGVTAVYVGSDISLEALQWGRQNVLPGLPAAAADVHHLPYPNDTFPLVMCLEVLEHIPDSAVGLRELARVSSEFVIFSVPHEPYFRGLNFLRGKHWSRWGNDPEHLHTYSGRALKRMAGRVPEIEVLGHEYSLPWQIILARKTGV